MGRISDDSPRQFATLLREEGLGRAYLVFDPDRLAYAASHPLLQGLADELASARDCSHEAVFFEAGHSADALYAAFVHRTVRGQAQGGLRRRSYESVGELMHDGLRLSRAMTRKNALAGLWWGGGKGLIAHPGDGVDRERRRALYGEYAAFISSLRGCYVTAEDAGTTPVDMAEVFRATRFTTCVPREAGGSGNPARMTAAGVMRAMEAAMDFHRLGSLEGKTVALQGTGNVGSALIECLLERGVSRVVASEISAERRAALLDTFEGRPLEVRLAAAGNDRILSEACDVLAPCALGGVLGPKSIPGVQARIVCGAADNPLVDEERDALALQRRGITFVPDFVANRMGIVYCSNEQYGHVNCDPATLRHLDPDWPYGIYQTTLRVLELAERGGTTPTATAAGFADDLAEAPHPIWGHRGRRIIDSLVADRWERAASR